MKEMSQEILVVFIGLLFQQLNAADWGYTGAHGPSHWADDYDKCGGKSQSPIDIKTEDVHYKDLADFTFSNYDTKSLQMKLKNNGHAAQIDIESGDAYVHGGGLPGNKYKLAQFHFHWGSDSSMGSEHLYNGKAYPVEMHLVHYDTKYNSLSDAATKPEGLAVLGIFLQKGTSNNDDYDPIIEKLKDIHNKDNNVDLAQIRLDTLLPSKLDEFFRYDGSLTTPGCYESVTWTVFSNAVKLSESQIAEFRKLKDGSQHTLVNNYRPVQALNKRHVVTSDEALAGGASRMSPAIATFSFLLFCVATLLS